MLTAYNTKHGFVINGINNKQRIFVDQDGLPIRALNRGFSSLLEAADLLFDSNGNRREAYSLRHYYATQRLLSGVSVYVLAENMGTSVAMIEKYYGHVRPELAADELTKER